MGKGGGQCIVNEGNGERRASEYRDPGSFLWAIHKAAGLLGKCRVVNSEAEVSQTRKNVRERAGYRRAAELADVLPWMTDVVGYLGFEFASWEANLLIVVWPSGEHRQWTLPCLGADATDLERVCLGHSTSVVRGAPLWQLPAQLSDGYHSQAQYSS